MNETDADGSSFQSRFMTHTGVERYRDRYRSGRHARTHRLEQAVLGEILDGVGTVSVALDIPCGTGRLSPVLGRYCERLIVADGSSEMLQAARGCLLGVPAEFLQTRAESIKLPDKSVDLIFCHRFLHHVADPDARVAILTEFGRVSRRYVLVPYYSRGLRTRARRLVRSLWARRDSDDGILTLRKFLDEASLAGFQVVQERTMRRFPSRAVFCLLERR